MLFKNVTIIDENFAQKDHMYVGTVGDRIAYVSDKAPENEAGFGEIYPENSHRVLMPAFCTAHAHMPMTLLRGHGENEPLWDWLTKRIFPFEAKLQGKDVYYATLLCAAEAARFGVVSASEMYFFGSDMARAFIESGMKANCCLSVSNFGDEHYRDLPICAENDALIRDYDGAADGRFAVTMCIHSEYTTKEQVVREIAEIAQERNKMIQVHVSETQSEVEDCKKRHGGLSPVQYLDQCGVFEVPVTAAHCVYLSEEDISILKNKKVSVASCPKSNLKLASGIAPAARYIAEGINVAIGTDGVASNNNFNMMEEMKFFNLLQKYYCRDAAALTPVQSLYAATRAGFLSQQRDDCGLLKEGYKADLVVLDTDKPYAVPCDSILNHIAYSACGTDVVLTMCDGKVLYRDGEYTTIDIEKVSSEVKASKERILAELAG